MTPKPLRLGSSLPSWPLQTAEPASPSLLAPPSPATPRFPPQWNASPQAGMSRFVVPTPEARPSSQTASLVHASEASTPTSFHDHDARSEAVSFLDRHERPLLCHAHPHAGHTTAGYSRTPNARGDRSRSEAARPSTATDFSKSQSSRSAARGPVAMVNSVHAQRLTTDECQLPRQSGSRFSAYTAGCVQDLGGQESFQHLTDHRAI